MLWLIGVYYKMLFATSVWSKTRKIALERQEWKTANDVVQQQVMVNRSPCTQYILYIQAFRFLNIILMESLFLQYFFTEIIHKLQVNSVYSLSWKVVPWRKALTSGVSRQWSRERCRKQSSACFCFTSSDMTWPLHRSPPDTMGFLLKSRPSVCMCVSVCPLS